MKRTTWYKFDSENKEFLKEFTADLRPNGMEIEEYINATKLIPPKTKDKEVAVFEESVWKIQEDHRQKRDSSGVIIETSGTRFWNKDDKYGTPCQYLKDIGPLPVGTTTIEPKQDPNEKLKNDKRTIRSERDRRLSETSWIIERHTSQKNAGIKTNLSEEEFKEILLYQQSLRDIPQQKGFPWNGDIEKSPFPIKPSFI